MHKRFYRNPNVQTFVSPRASFLPLPCEMMTVMEAFDKILPVTKKFAMEHNVEAEFQEAVRREQEVTNEPLQIG